MSRVIITGCSSGIGRELVIDLTKRGHDVIATARRLSAIEDLPAAMALELDVTDDASVAAAVATAGHIDVLINNAGVTAWSPVECMPIAEARRLLETNFLGALRMMQAVLPQMRARRKGRIINVSTPSAIRSNPLIAFYASSKAALENLTEALRVEIGHLGVDVIIAEPGGVVSAFADNRVDIEVTDPDYVDLMERVKSVFGTGASRMTSAEAAAGIADLLEIERPKLRYGIGKSGERLIALRRDLDDEEYEAAARKQLGLELP